MPTVPMYSQRQVQSAALPANGVSVQTSPETFGAGFGELGQRVAGLFAEHQQRANVAMSQDALLQFQSYADDQLNNPETGLMTKQGKDVIGQADATLTNIRGKADELMQTLPEGQVRDNFLRQVNASGQQYKNQARTFEIGQVRQYETNQFQGILTSGVQNVSQMYGDNRAYVEGNKQIFDQIDQFGSAHGWSSEQIQAKKIEFKEQAAQQAVQNQLGADYMNFIAQNGEPADMGGSMRASSGNQADPRGVRNNNPGNIVSTDQKWDGQTGSDGSYAQFATPEHGIRALGKNLLSYQRQGFDTVQQIITRWAPPHENDTAAYIKAVSGRIGVAPGDRLDLTNIGTLTSLSKAIMQQENGQMNFTDQQIGSGLQAALGINQLPPAESAPKRLTGMAAFDALNAADQGKFMRQAEAIGNEQKAQYRSQLDISVKDAYSALDEGLMPQQLPSGDDFFKAYGPAQGARKWHDMKEQQAYGGVIAAAKSMTPGARQALLDNAKPTDANDPNFAANQQRWDKMKNKFSELDKDWNRNQGRLMVNNALNNGVALDPSNKSNKDAADSYFDSQFNNFNIKNNDEVNAVTSFVAKTGIIPTRLASQLNAASAVKDPAVAIPAAEMVSRIYDANPVALNSMPNEKQSFYLNAKRLKDAGVNAESAIDQAFNLAYNQTDALKAQLASEQGTSSYKKDRLSAASDFVSDMSQFFRIDPSAKDTNADAARFRQDYQSLYDLNYRTSGGDADIAKKMTSQQISRTWSISEVNGSAMLMKYAPEALHQGGPGGWQAQQWEKERNILVYGTEDIPAASAAGGGIGRVSTANTSRPEPKVKGDVILVPDVSTPRNGDYAIMISDKDKDGVPTLQPYYDESGRPLRYRPDLESWKPYQELLNDQRAGAEQTMQKAQERREFYDTHREFDDQYKESHEQRIGTQKTQLQNYFKWGKE